MTGFQDIVLSSGARTPFGDFGKSLRDTPLSALAVHAVQASIARAVAGEAGVTAFWHKYVGLEGAVVGIDTYGESAPAGALFKHFGLTAEKVAQAVKKIL